MITYHQHKYFTLIELLSVIGIIAIVAGIILGGMSYAGRRADQAKTISLMTQLEMALDAFKQDRGYYPVTNDPDDLDVYFVIVLLIPLIVYFYNLALLLERRISINSYLSTATRIAAPIVPIVPIWNWVW